MARYIDADELRRRVKEKTNPYGKPTLDYESGVKVLNMIDNAPTADVAPRAEVDKQIAKQKAMVLDVIDTFRNLLCIESYLDYEDTRPHYCVSIDDVNRIHAELKKKYTEPDPPKGD